MFVDAHQHFWSLSRRDYGWLTPHLGDLYRDYLPGDLVPILTSHGVQATVLIQAAPTEAETQYLFELADSHSFVAGVVGWIDFDGRDVERRMEVLLARGNGKLKGLRPMVQDIPDAQWLGRHELDRAFAFMSRRDLVFEALVRPSQLEVLRSRLLRHPDLVAVLDHAGKPAIGYGDFDDWARDVARLARDTRALCKLSGLLTEARGRRSLADLMPYVKHIFECFGATRVLWGSDWPVLNGVADYADWLSQARELVGHCAKGQETNVFGHNAVRTYKLDLTWTGGNPP
jgi:L-fuconolactonase